MEVINKLLDKAKEISSSRTDMALAEKLGIEATTLSSYRNDRSKPNVVVCAKIAAITNEPLNKVIGIVEEARAISSEEKKVWRRFAQVAIVSFALISSSSVFASGSVGLRVSNAVCLLCKHLMRRASRFILLWFKNDLLRSRSPNHRYVDLQPNPLAGEMAWLAFSR